jgi:pSer/pThr/pTyr-binding forkhead associated (FHA) protein
MIGRADPSSGSFPDVDLEGHNAQQSGISRQHAKITAQGGYFLEDLNSVNGTWLNRQKLLSGQKMPLNNGDEIRLGKMVLNFYTS